MNIMTLKSQIKEKKLDNFYVFAGDEWEVQKVYIHKIAEVCNLKVKYIDSIKDIYSKLTSNSFFKESYCYIVRDDPDIMKEDKLQEQIKNNLLGNNILILLLTNADRRSKVFKTFEYCYITFEEMPLERLRKRLKQMFENLTDKTCDRLISACENNYGRLLLEVDKIINYGVYDILGDYNDIINKLLDDGAIYTPPEDAVFDLIDAILKRDVKSVYYLLDNCQQIGESNLVILSNLYNATKQLLQVQSCESYDIEGTTGLTYPQIKAAQSRQGNYSIGELVNVMKLIREVERDIKIGNIEEDISVEYVLVNIL